MVDGQPNGAQLLERASVARQGWARDVIARTEQPLDAVQSERLEPRKVLKKRSDKLDIMWQDVDLKTSDMPWHTRRTRRD